MYTSKLSATSIWQARVGKGKGKENMRKSGHTILYYPRALWTENTGKKS